MRSAYTAALRKLSKSALVQTIELLSEKTVGLDPETVLKFAGAADRAALARRIESAQAVGTSLLRQALGLGLLEQTPSGLMPIRRRTTRAEDRLLHRLRCTGVGLARMNRRLEKELDRDGRKRL